MSYLVKGMVVIDFKFHTCICIFGGGGELCTCVLVNN